MTDTFENMPLRKYLDAKGMSHRHLWNIKKTAEYCKWVIDHPEIAETTAPMQQGSALHAVGLKSGEAITVLPADLNRRTTAGKVQYEAIMKASQGGIVITAEQHEAVQGMAARLHKSPTFQKYLDGAKVEMSVFWYDNAILCKGRVDLFNPNLNLICDIKTTTRADDYSFQKTATDLGYFRQLAWYKKGLSRLYKIEHCVLVAIESTPPYEINMLRLDDNDLALAEAENADLLGKYRACLDTNEWPSYGDYVKDLKMLPYVAQRLQETYGIN